MSLQEKLTADMKAAMKARDRVRLGTIRMLISDLKNEQIAKGDRLDEQEELTFLAKQAKRRRESIEAFDGGGRDEQAATERAELEVIETYLPEPLSEDEVRKIVGEVIANVGATSVADLGKVMGAVMPHVKGRFPGAGVRPIVSELLTAG